MGKKNDFTFFGEINLEKKFESKEEDASNKLYEYLNNEIKNSKEEDIEQNSLSSIPHSIKVEKIYDENVRQLLQLDPKEYYRLVVDGAFHEKESGWMGYSQRQAGSVAALLNGLALAFESEEAGLTPRFIQELHSTVTKVPRYGKLCTSKLRENPTGFHLLLGENLSREGFFELINKYSDCVKIYKNEKYIRSVKELENHEHLNLSTDSSAWTFLEEAVAQGYKIFYVAPPASMLPSLLETICTTYNTEIIKPGLSDKEKIAIIRNAVQTLEQAHCWRMQTVELV